MKELRTVDELLTNPWPDHVQHHQIVSALVLCEFIDDDGEIRLGSTRVGPLWRASGMARVAARVLEERLVYPSREDEDEGDDDAA